MLRFVSFALLSATASAQIVVLDGDDLAATCATAPDGSLIVIQSNGTFIGTLNWSDKALSIRAADGFSPTIQGDPDTPALSFLSGNTSLRLEGVTVLPGESVQSSSLLAVLLNGTSQLPEAIDMDLEACSVEGSIISGGTGDLGIEIELTNSSVAGSITAGGTSDSTLLLRVVSGSSLASLRVDPLGDAVCDVLVRNSTILGDVSFDAGSDSAVTAVLRRTRVLGEVEVSKDLLFSQSQVDVLMESCLIVGSGVGQGVEVGSEAGFRGVNLTVTGFPVGIEASEGSEFVNCLVYGNGDDLDLGTPGPSISSSLIEDGTLAGSFGNIGGTPAVAEDFALIEGSLGIDAGDSAAADLGALDLVGAPRVQDGDGDLVPVVNAGAVETVATCPSGSFVFFNGSGLNPTALSIPQAPSLGSLFTVNVQGAPGTVATVVAIGAPAPGGLAFPGVLGELLLAPSPFPDLDFAAGTHLFPIPDDATLCGAQAGIQGLRVDSGLSLEFTQAALLTLGS